MGPTAPSMVKKHQPSNETCANPGYKSVKVYQFATGSLSAWDLFCADLKIKTAAKAQCVRGDVQVRLFWRRP